MGIDVQDPERGVAGSQGPDQAVGRRMVAADQPHDLPRIEPPGGLGLDVGVQGPAPFVHPADLPHHMVVIEASAPFEVVDHPFGIAPQALRKLQQRIVHVGRGDTPAPDTRGQGIVEIQLRRRLDDRIRGIGRSRPGRRPSRPHGAEISTSSEVSGSNGRPK